MICNFKTAVQQTKMSKVHFAKQSFKKAFKGLDVLLDNHEGQDHGSIVEADLSSFVDQISKHFYDDVTDVTTTYYRGSKSFEIYYCGGNKLAKKMADKKSPRFEMEESVRGARYVSQTDFSPNLVLLMCKNCEGCCSYMTWFSGDENATLHSKACDGDEFKTHDVVVNSDEFMTILGLAHGILTCK